MNEPDYMTEEQWESFICILETAVNVKSNVTDGWIWEVWIDSVCKFSDVHHKYHSLFNIKEQLKEDSEVKRFVADYLIMEKL